jgi:oxygen-independent coproporphyrinogen-3 oxidase
MYAAAVRRDGIPLHRAYKPTGDERLIRELILQLKLGSIKPPYFRDKYGVSILDRFRDQFTSLSKSGDLKTANDEVVALTRQGLLHVDALLSRFFLPQHAGIRYT